MTANGKTIAISLATALLLGGGGLAYWIVVAKPAPADSATHLDKAVYTCPMHPSVRSDHPGSCPVCGMNLVKQVSNATPPAEAHAEHQAADGGGLHEVALSPQQMVTANVQVTTVSRRTLSREVLSPGKVSFDETRQSNVTAWVSGRIDRLYVSRTGATIRKGQPIAEIYSPDLMTAQQEYLTALESHRALSGTSFKEISHGSRQLLESSRTRLKLLGVTDAQIARIDETRRPMVEMTIYSPVSGTVTQKIAQLGQFVAQGQPLFQVADLSRVWVEAPIHEDQLEGIRVGHGADLTAAAFPGRTFHGRISFLSPVVEPQTRTVQARIELANEGGRLKPDMFVDARIRVPMGEQLVVPATAVVETGTRRVVWIETKPTAFTPREVKLGHRSGDVYPILSGLASGERIAATGAYLIDSSSQMRSLGSGSMPGMDHGAGAMPESEKTDAAEHSTHESMPGMQK